MQSLDILVYGIWAFGLAFLVFSAGNAFLHFRVNDKEEIAGLNISEHGLRHESEMQSPMQLIKQETG